MMTTWTASSPSRRLLDPLEAKQHAALRKLAARIHSASVTLLTAPLGAVLGVAYLIRAAKSRVRPRGHKVTVITILEDWALTAALAAVAGLICWIF